MKEGLQRYYCALIILFVISSILQIIAFGRHKAWDIIIKRFGCESTPPVPSIFEAFQAFPLLSFESLIAFGIPFVLIILFLISYKSSKLLFFLIPILFFHILIRYTALIESKSYWGYCELKGDGVTSAVVLDIIILCNAIICVVFILIFKFIVSFFKTKKLIY